MQLKLNGWSWSAQPVRLHLAQPNGLEIPCGFYERQFNPLMRGKSFFWLCNCCYFGTGLFYLLLCCFYLNLNQQVTWDLHANKFFRYEFKASHENWVNTVKPKLGLDISTRVLRAVNFAHDNIKSLYAIRNELRAALKNLLKVVFHLTLVYWFLTTTPALILLAPFPESSCCSSYWKGVYFVVGAGQQ